MKLFAAFTIFGCSLASATPATPACTIADVDTVIKATGGPDGLAGLTVASQLGIPCLTCLGTAAGDVAAFSAPAELLKNSAKVASMIGCLPLPRECAKVPETQKETIINCVSADDKKACIEGIQCADKCLAMKSCYFKLTGILGLSPPKEKCPLVMPCADGKKPGLGETGCPTCTFVPPACTDKLKILACVQSLPTLPMCTRDSVKVLDDDCCLGCAPPKPEIRDGDIKCECPADKVAALEDCVAGAKPEYDAATCCRTCKPANIEKKNDCTKEDFHKCKNETVVCEAEEKATRLNGTCCPSCFPASRSVTPVKAATLKRMLRKCGETERPVRLDGSAMPSCKKMPSPKCVTKCEKPKKCTRKGCVGRRVAKLVLRIKKGISEAKDANATKEDVYNVITEVIERFCDKLANDTVEKLCGDGNMEKFIDALEVKKAQKREIRTAGKSKLDEADTVDMEIEIERPERPSGPSRRLLADEQDLLGAAMEDQDATEGTVDIVESTTTSADTTTKTPEDDSNDPASPAASVLSGVLAPVLAIGFALLA